MNKNKYLEVAVPIKEIDKSEFIRSSLSRLWDLILYPQDKINYWHYKDLKQFLEELGCASQTESNQQKWNA